MNTMPSLCSYVHAACFLYAEQYYFTDLSGKMLDISEEIAHISYIHMWIQKHRHQQQEYHMASLYNALTHDNIPLIYHRLRCFSDVYAALVHTNPDLMWILSETVDDCPHEWPLT